MAWTCPLAADLREPSVSVGTTGKHHVETKLLVLCSAPPHTPHMSVVHPHPASGSNFIFTKQAPHFIPPLFLFIVFLPSGPSFLVFSPPELLHLQDPCRMPLNHEGLTLSRGCALIPLKQAVPAFADIYAYDLFSYKLRANSLSVTSLTLGFVFLWFGLKPMNGKFLKKEEEIE